MEAILSFSSLSSASEISLSYVSMAPQEHIALHTTQILPFLLNGQKEQKELCEGSLSLSLSQVMVREEPFLFTK